MSSLADRIRAVVGAPNPVARIPGESQIPIPESQDLSALGGAWRGDTYVIERRSEPQTLHGREPIGALAERLGEAAAEATLFAGGAPRAPFVFFDLETTGLSGGAGTLAFLIGCAWFEPDGALVTRQFLLTRYADERTLLETVARELARAGALVSFNGKSFDAPLLETRYLFHRLDWIGTGIPHIDVLHPARQFWKREAHDVARAFQASESSCSLGALERQIVGARRIGDVPGFEIPARYFQFLRSGDARPLAAVLEHNRLDLVTLAALTAHLLHLARTGHVGARDAREALALGRVYGRGGLEARACAAFRHAVELSDRGMATPPLVRIDSLRVLARALRRTRQYVDAAACWRRLLAERECPPLVAREATLALAVHHEHRERDLATAKVFALRSLETGPDRVRQDAARHRLARLERKMTTAPTLEFPSLPSPPSSGSPTSVRRTSS